MRLQLNPSIQTYCTDVTTERLQAWFFERGTLSDVKMEVHDDTTGQSEVFAAHKCILMARCEPLNRMLTNTAFSEANGGRIEIHETSPSAWRSVSRAWVSWVCSFLIVLQFQAAFVSLHGAHDNVGEQ